jgi:hypothetical protein
LLIPDAVKVQLGQPLRGFLLAGGGFCFASMKRENATVFPQMKIDWRETRPNFPKANNRDTKCENAAHIFS